MFSATARHRAGTQVRSRPAGWPLERVLFALAGSMTLLSAALSALLSPWFLVLSVLVGINQWLYVISGACPASLLLVRLFSLQSVIYPAPAARSYGNEDR